MLTGFSSLSLADLSRDFRCCIFSIIMETSSSESAESWLSLAGDRLLRVAFVSAVFSMSNYSQHRQDWTAYCISILLMAKSLVIIIRSGIYVSMHYQPNAFSKKSAIFFCSLLVLHKVSQRQNMISDTWKLLTPVSNQSETITHCKTACNKLM